MIFATANFQESKCLNHNFRKNDETYNFAIRFLPNLNPIYNKLLCILQIYICNKLLCSYVLISIKLQYKSNELPCSALSWKYDDKVEQMHAIDLIAYNKVIIYTMHLAYNVPVLNLLQIADQKLWMQFLSTTSPETIQRKTDQKSRRAGAQRLKQ